MVFWNFSQEKSKATNKKIIMSNDKPTYEDLLKIVEKQEKQLRILKTNQIGGRKNLFQTLFTDSYSIMLIIDFETGQIINANKSACEFYGYSCDEITSMYISQINTLPSEEVKREMQKAKSEVRNFFNFKHKLKNGQIKDVEVHSGKIVLDNKTYLYSIINDATEKITKDTELIAAKEKAEESDRLKSAFLQNLSHEIRTPLNSICGFSERLNKPQLSDEKRKSFVSIIQNSSNQLLSIISDVLSISALETKQEKVNIEKICINNIITDLLSIFKQQTINRNISLYAKKSLSDKQSEIYTDKTKITQILSNLLSNALKFTHEGFVEFGYNLKNNELEFYVKDSGIGIKSELQEKIFERFAQADHFINKKYGGTGLGLAISKGFVELLDGEIWVNSVINDGSTFYFTIPYRPVNENGETTSKTKLNKEKHKPTILVAEDVEFNFLLIEELLSDFDFKLIHAKDGQETVEIFKTNPDISLILMDIKMPIMDGYTAAKIIKEQKPELPIIAQSGYAVEQEIEMYSEIFDAYLTKPLSENELKATIQKYFDK